jgi:hypothetical protein
MTGTSSIDNTQFRRILSRNVAMPLGMGVLSALVFVGIIAYLINVLSWVEHSEQVIGQAPTRSAAVVGHGSRHARLRDVRRRRFPRALPGGQAARIDSRPGRLARGHDNPAQVDRIEPGARGPGPVASSPKR